MTKLNNDLRSKIESKVVGCYGHKPVPKKPYHPTTMSQEVQELRDMIVTFSKATTLDYGWAMTTSTDDIFKWAEDEEGGRVYNGNETGKRYAIINHGNTCDSGILLTVHLDTVCELPGVEDLITTKSELQGKCFDDRLGLFIATVLLPEICDTAFTVLLTDFEESGKSTAEYVSKEYLDKFNLIIGLDRLGAGYVDYGYGSTEIDRVLSEMGMIKDFGSYSDICYLDTTTARINFGIGYEAAHSEKSWVKIDAMAWQLHRLNILINEQHDVKYTTLSRKLPKKRIEQTYKSSYDGWDYCGQSGTIDDEIAYTVDTCEFCGEKLDNDGADNEELCMTLCSRCYVISKYGWRIFK